MFAINKIFLVLFLLYWLSSCTPLYRQVYFYNNSKYNMKIYYNTNTISIPPKDYASILLLYGSDTILIDFGKDKKIVYIDDIISFSDFYSKFTFNRMNNAATDCIVTYLPSDPRNPLSDDYSDLTDKIIVLPYKL